MKYTKLMVLALVATLAGNAYAQKKKAANEPTVRIATGVVQGIEQEGTEAFLGIPYAKVERFMPPQPAPPYTAENGEMMILDYNCRVRNNPDRQLASIINKYCFKQLDEFEKNKNLESLTPRRP